MDAFIDFTSGTIGGVANVYAGQPLDTVKVKMQTYPHLYRNAFYCVVQTLKLDGVAKGLYAGTVPALIANVSTNAVLFFSYGQCKKIVADISKKDVKKLTPTDLGLAGSGAAVLASLVLCPSDLVKCRLQAARETNPNNMMGPYSMFKQLYKEGGFRIFFTGLKPLLVREIPGYFVFFGIYELARELFTPAFKTKDDIGVVKTAVSGGLGGIASWIVVFPADVVKSRIQVDSRGSLGKQSFVNTLIKIVKTEGFGRLYYGLGPTIIRTFFSTGALFATVEETTKLMNKHLR